MDEPFETDRRPAPRAPVAGAPPRDVRALIDTAQGHPLGIEFLRHGAHDAVAATFGVHAFLVDAARDHLGTARTTSGPR